MGLLAAYLAQLPDGLASFPTCRAKASMIRTALETLPVSPDAPVSPDRSELPEVLRQHLRQPPLSTAWVSEAEYVAVCLAIADAHGLDVEGFRGFWYGSMVRLMSGLYATLLSWVDPRTALKTAAARWSVFHRGTDFTAVARGESVELVMRYPAPLLPEIVVSGYVGVLQALIDRSRKPQGTVRLIDISAEPGGRAAARFVADGWLR